MKKYKTRCKNIVILDDDWQAKLKKYMAIPYFQFPVEICVHKNGYAIFKYNYEIISVHRAMMNCYGPVEVDHINNNKLDNRVENLRLCTRHENMRNLPLSKNNTSGYKGVLVRKGKKKTAYDASITVNGKCIRLGSYDTAEDAARAYDEAAVKHHGLFAKTNKELGLL